MDKHKIELIKEDIVENYAGEIVYGALISEVKKRIIAPIFTLGYSTKQKENTINKLLNKNVFLRHEVLVDITEIRGVIRDVLIDASITETHLNMLNPVFWEISKRLDEYEKKKIRELETYIEVILQEEGYLN